MNRQLDALLRHYTRIDPRSLGLFRVLFGLALMGNWLERWKNRVAFYSNEGVLPNHNHLYQLKNKGRFVWSALHAFSTPGEAAVALALILVFFGLFTLGWKTRAFHVLSLVSLVSLSARNTLAEGPGDALAIILLGTTVFLPLGSRFSLDAFLGTAHLARETKPKHLLDTSTLPTEREVQRGRLPGWSPISVAATGLLLLLCLVLFAIGKQQSGPSWSDGTALHKTLEVFMLASPRGFAMKNSGLLGPLTRLLHASSWLVPLLVLLPFPRGIARGAAAVLLVLYGLTYALFTTFTLFGWCFVAAAALLIANESWDAWTTKHDPKRNRTVIFDVDCGICFWIVKMLRRYDSRKHLLFQGNGEFPPSGVEPKSDDPEQSLPMLHTWDEPSKSVLLRAMPAGITSSLVETTVVVVKPDGTFATRGGAVVEVMRALPGLWLVAAILDLPLVSALRDKLYDAVAQRRTAISVELGLNACGVVAATKEVPLKEATPPSKILRFRLLAAAREVGAAIFIGAVLIATTQLNGVGPKVASTKLEPVTWWTRAIPRWDVLAPEPPTTESMLVVDALTKGNRKLDLMTGSDPTISFDRPFPLGAMWANYLTNVTRDENKPFQEALRKYFAKRGPRFEPPEPQQVLQGADGFWLTKPTDAPEATSTDRLFRHARGGSVLNPTVSPLIAAPSASPNIPRVPGREPPVRPEPDLDEEPQKNEPLRFPEHPESPGQELQ